MTDNPLAGAVLRVERAVEEALILIESDASHGRASPEDIQSRFNARLNEQLAAGRPTER